MNEEIDFVRVQFDRKGAHKITKYKNGAVKNERITGEQAALIHAENGGF